MRPLHADYRTLEEPRLQPGMGSQAEPDEETKKMLCSSHGEGRQAWGAALFSSLARQGSLWLNITSPRDFEYLKSLGAPMVFDYKQADTFSRIITVLQNKTCAGHLPSEGL